MYAMLRNGETSSNGIMLQPHVVMRTNLEYFLREMAHRDDSTSLSVI
jgi:hypothetical protein